MSIWTIRIVLAVVCLISTAFIKMSQIHWFLLFWGVTFGLTLLVQPERLTKKVIATCSLALVGLLIFQYILASNPTARSVQQGIDGSRVPHMVNTAKKIVDDAFSNIADNLKNAAPASTPFTELEENIRTGVKSWWNATPTETPIANPSLPPRQQQTEEIKKAVEDFKTSTVPTKAVETFNYWFNRPVVGFPKPTATTIPAVTPTAIP